MPTKKKYLRIASARACTAALERRQETSKSPNIRSQSRDIGSDSDTAWVGGVNHYSSTDKGEMDREESDVSNETINDLSEEDVTELEKKMGLYKYIRELKTNKEWKKVQSNWALGYNGLSLRTQQCNAKAACERQVTREQAKMFNNPRVVLIRNYFAPKPQPTASITESPGSSRDIEDEWIELDADEYMALGIKLYSWSTTLRDMLHMRKMLLWPIA
ncbi:hypothetical protein C0991_004780 [Blastosporella zonata]|nr:hypothetical protein C0991_004780 [Blastosporella zonata]